ncbi:hypothetical protein [Candidatus Aquicultor secundus]|nr:hypothetical protein [Candidatus Aquicultor secundus]
MPIRAKLSLGLAEIKRRGVVLLNNDVEPVVDAVNLLLNSLEFSLCTAM